MANGITMTLLDQKIELKRRIEQIYDQCLDHAQAFDNAAQKCLMTNDDVGHWRSVGAAEAYRNVMRWIRP